MENQANRILWSPSVAQQANACLADFRAAVEADTGLAMQTYDDLYAWSVREPTRFWDRLWAFLDLVGDRGNGPTLVQGRRMQDTRWFPGARLNYAENLLRRRDHAEAMVSWCDGGTRRRRLSFAELYDAVSRLAQMLAASGVGQGDRVAGYLPNIPETIVAMLATASLGAIWSSCSPDFGIDGAAERFGQIEPKVLFAADGYHYAGKAIDTLDRARELTMRITSIERLVIVPVLSETPEIDGVAGALTLDTALKPFAARDIEFVRLPFDHPLVHPLFLGHDRPAEVHRARRRRHLCCSISRSMCCTAMPARAIAVLLFTTCGWMMWNWLVSGLATGARWCCTTARRSAPDRTCSSTGRATNG